MRTRPSLTPVQRLWTRLLADRDACSNVLLKVLGGLSKEYTDEVIEALGLMLMDIDDCYGAHLRIIKLFGDVDCLAVHRQYFVAVLVAGLLGQAEEQGLFETFKMAPPKVRVNIIPWLVLLPTLSVLG